MQKIPTLFARDEATNRRHVKNDLTRGCEWVIDGEGRPTRKIDGMCCLVRDGALFKRREFKVEEPNGDAGVLVIPEGTVAWPEQTAADLIAQHVQARGDSRLAPGFVKVPDDFDFVAYDPDTGKVFGWMPVGDSKEDARHRDAWDNNRYLSLTFKVEAPPPNGTYELIGPKVNGNPEHVNEHMLIQHGYGPAADRRFLDSVPRSFDALATWMQTVATELGWEGIVWHHEDGRMAKLKRKDFPRGEPTLT